jgi:two-component system, response regulator YesN
MHKIMLIEDERIFRENLEYILEAEGYEVLSFIDAFTALDSLASPVAMIPQLVICDIHLPNMSGIEFMRHMKNIYSKQQSPHLIFTSVMRNIKKITQDIDSDSFDYLAKPINFDIMLPKIRSIIERNNL